MAAFGQAELPGLGTAVRLDISTRWHTYAHAEFYKKYPKKGYMVATRGP